MKRFNHKRAKQGLGLLLFCSFVFVQVINYSNEDVNYRRMLSISQNCTITPTKEVAPDDVPIFIASFPGSGARMSWQLTEALTGKPTGDEWDTNGFGKNVIAVKTHWPHPSHGMKLEWGDEIKRVFVMVRNPLHVLPAFHNFIYTSMSEDEGVKIAPTEAWLKWRDSNFNQQLFLWRVSIQYWLDKYSAEDRIVIPYERIVDDIDGPKFTQQLNEFLGDGDNGAIDPELVPCIWSKVISQEDSQLEQMIPNLTAKDALGRRLFRTDSYYERSYTKEQYNQMIVIVRNLRVKYVNDQRLDNTFKMYDAAIKKARDGQTFNNLFIK